MNVVWDNLDAYWDGMRVTIELALVSYVLSLLVGVLVVTLRISPAPPARAAGLVYVETVRNTPLLVLLLLMFFGLTKVGLTFTSFVTAVLAFALYHGAFVAEALRSGVNAVPAGQAEAARSIGLRFSQVLTVVVLPQAFRTVVPPLGNIFIALTKNTSLAAVIGLNELTLTADRLNTEFTRAVPIFLGAAIAYCLITIPAGYMFGAVERRVAIRR